MASPRSVLFPKSSGIADLPGETFNSEDGK
jgi:hypothetical protein